MVNKRDTLHLSWCPPESLPQKLTNTKFTKN